MSFFDNFSVYLAAASKGAASVYHSILGTGVAVKDWETAHPAIAPLIAQGTTFANAFVTRATGLPMGTIEVAAEDVLASLQTLAAQDATVPSVPTSTVTTTSAVTSLGSVEQAVGLAADVAIALNPSLAPVLDEALSVEKAIAAG
jgi:hypothetical protein